MEINFDQTKLSIVLIDKVHPNAYNPKDKKTPEYENIKRGIKLKGLRLPIIVRDDKEKGDFEIIDGEQRWNSCKELGYDKMLIYNEGAISDKEARELTLWYEQKVPFNQVELAQLVADMSETWGDLEVPYSEDEIEEFINMTAFDFDEYAGNEEKSDADLNYFSYKVTKDQKELIDQAINKAKEEAENLDMSEGRSLELIAGDYLAGK